MAAEPITCVIRYRQQGKTRLAEAIICQGPHRKSVERIGPMAEAELRVAVEKKYPGIVYR